MTLTIKWMLDPVLILGLPCKNSIKLCWYGCCESAWRYCSMSANDIIGDLYGDLRCRWQSYCEALVDRELGGERRNSGGGARSLR